MRRVYMRAKDGTKAIIEFPDGTQTDAWFWWRRASPGDVLLVQGETGWGPHHHRAVFYIGSKYGGHGVAGSIPLAAWRAHRRRAAGP
ncbi:hypothetical protein [Tessaracoccus caeni]|uniref:hypothetical protein n=1 Tax=Tessaracoccus caeni TaxID=3031239 RepID=UPI0023DC2663|nr:hypothetical protein [Tessaracoccus caeni]MDF1490398.1 hypothetical protein [Tessaracoccus caeni]